MLNLDTHIVIALLAGDLKDAERDVIVRSDWAICGIVLWETAKLVQLRRVELDLEDPRYRDFLQAVTIIPISPEIARQSTRLDFQADPADELIAATSIVEGLPLVTRDSRIRASKLIRLAV